MEDADGQKSAGIYATAQGEETEAEAPRDPIGEREKNSDFPGAHILG